MKFLKSFLTVVLLTMTFALSAQSLTNGQRRNMNARLLELVEQYETNSVVYDKASVYAFKDLFVSEEAGVYNDMLEYPAESVTVDEYVKKLSERENLSIVVKDVGHGEYSFEKGEWHSLVTMEKSLSYNDANGVLFSNEEYYGADYELVLDCVYDARRDRFRIASIEGRMLSEVPHLPARFDIIVHNTPEDDKVLVEGEHMKFNSFSQAFVPKGSIVPWDDDVRITKDVQASTDVYEMMKLGFKYTRLRVKPHFACTAGPAFKVNSPVDFTEKKSFGYELGVDLGYTIPVGPVTLGLFTGLAYSHSSLNLATGGIEYSYETSNESGQGYIRNYSISRLSEGVAYSDISIPLYVNVDYKVAPDWLLSFNLGMKLYMNGKTTVTPYHVTAEVSATELVPGPFDALGTVDGDYTAFLFPTTYSRNNFDTSLVTGLGVNYNVYDGLVFVYAKIGFEYGLNDIHTSSNRPIYDEDGNYPLVYTIYDGGMNVATQSLWNCISFKRLAFWPEIGVMFKF